MTRTRDQRGGDRRGHRRHHRHDRRGQAAGDRGGRPRHTAYVSNYAAGTALVISASFDPGPVIGGPIFVRSDAPAGEADLVTQGPGNTLQYSWATPGGSWSHFQVAGTATTYSG